MAANPSGVRGSDVPRSNAREPAGGVFRAAEDFERYLEDLEKFAGEDGIEVLAFCLMTNHVHLCVRTTESGAPLSAFIQRLNLRHVRRYNRTYRVRGHLNESRYKAQVVDNEGYLLTLVGYIHQNPVKARMVESPEQWKYSSHRAYLGDGMSWVKKEEVLLRAGGLEGYLRAMERRLAKPEWKIFEPDKQGRLSELADFRSLKKWTKRQEGPWTMRRPTRPIWEAVAEVEQDLGIGNAEIASGGQTPAERDARRRVAAALREQGYYLHEIATVLGRQEAAVSRMLRRVDRCAEAQVEYGMAA